MPFDHNLLIVRLCRALLESCRRIAEAVKEVPASGRTDYFRLEVDVTIRGVVVNNGVSAIFHQDGHVRQVIGLRAAVNKAERERQCLKFNVVLLLVNIVLSITPNTDSVECPNS